MRERDRRFAEALVAEIGAAGGVITDEGMLRAAREVWRVMTTPLSDAKLLARVKRKLKQPDVREAIGSAYQAAGFDVAEAVQLHIDHIRGNITVQKTVVVGKGEDATVEVVDVKLPPNYAALKDYEAMVLPKAPVRSDVRVQHIPAPDRLPGHSGVPAMRARVIGATTAPALPAGKPAAREAVEEAAVRDDA